MERKMSGVFITVGDISPRVHPKYSENLYKWVRRWIRDRHRFPGVYVDSNEDFYVGEKDPEDLWFYGNRLRTIWCDKTAKTWAYTNLQEVRLLPEFWTDYVLEGRCVIDTEHRIVFLNEHERWAYSEDGKERSCLWCKRHRQKLQRKFVTTKTECWEPV